MLEPTRETRRKSSWRWGGRVVGFEPQIECHGEILARFGGDKRFTLVKAAIGSSVGEAMLEVNQASPGQSSLIKGWSKKAGKGYSVPVRTLDGAIEEFGVPKYVKVDVEGFEVEVFKGLHQPIPVISFEYHLWEREAGKVEECLQLLSALGPIKVNCVTYTDTQLKNPQWLDCGDFLKFLKQLEKEDHVGNLYGDVFVRSL